MDSYDNDDLLLMLDDDLFWVEVKRDYALARGVMLAEANEADAECGDISMKILQDEM